MPEAKLSQFILLPELKMKGYRQNDRLSVYEAEKIKTECEVCPRCATASRSVYDRRTVRVRDEPLRRAQVLLEITKRRYWCKPCKKPFTEPVPGIMPRRRTTQRLRRAVAWACDNFTDLSKVRKHYRLSSNFIYQVFYEQLELKQREYNYPWPKVIGIDEHFFSRRNGFSEFVTVLTDMKGQRLRAVAKGKTKIELIEQLHSIEGRDNVRLVALDLSDSYKSFVKEFFPNAEMVADKFHVLRLLSPSLHRGVKEIVGFKFKHPMRKLLLRNGQKLSLEERSMLNRFLVPQPELRELYHCKERLYGFYRIRGFERAKTALSFMIEDMTKSKLEPIQRLRRTLHKWRNEILNYFKTNLTNARTEGFNNVAKLVQKRAYGFKSFKNYRLRLLNACA
jgi:transposase